MRIDLEKDPDNEYAKIAAKKEEAYLEDYKQRVAERKKAKQTQVDVLPAEGKVIETEGGREALRELGVTS